MTCDQCGGSFEREYSSCTTCGAPKTASARSILGDDDSLSVHRQQSLSDTDNRPIYFCRGAGLFIAFVAMDAGDFQHAMAGLVVAAALFLAPDIWRKIS